MYILLSLYRDILLFGTIPDGGVALAFYVLIIIFSGSLWVFWRFKRRFRELLWLQSRWIPSPRCSSYTPPRDPGSLIILPLGRESGIRRSRLSRIFLLSCQKGVPLEFLGKMVQVNQPCSPTWQSCLNHQGDPSRSGAGFHPEYTGRANIYMYGSIKGPSKKSIDERMPDIIHFCELEDFIDQPLQTYSSWMYPRLAFSVAVYVSAEILIIDEIRQLEMPISAPVFQEDSWTEGSRKDDPLCGPWYWSDPESVWSGDDPWGGEEDEYRGICPGE